MIYFSRHIPTTFLQFWTTDFWGKMYQQSVYWFLGTLLFLFIGLGVVFSQSDRLRTSTRRISISTRKLFVVFAAIMSLAFFALNLFIYIDNWSHIYLLVFQPVRVPLYIGYFILGLYAERHSWFMPDGFNPELGPWAATCFLTGLGYLACRWTSAAPNVLLIIVTAILFNVFCLSSLVAGILFFRQKVNSAGAVWQGLAANSYGIYYVHPLILYPLAYLFVGVSLPLIAKASALILATILLSWTVSALLLKRLPVVRAMF